MVDKEGESAAHTHFLHLWQKENLIDHDGSKLGKKADALRFSAVQLQYLKQCVEADSAAIFSKTREVLVEYGQLVDNQEKGLNNYAEPILSLLGNNNNESKKWKCKLNAADVCKKYLTPKDEVPDAIKEDLALLTQHLNSAEDRDLQLPSRVKNSLNDVNNGNKNSKRPIVNEEISDGIPSFALFDCEMMDEPNKRNQVPEPQPFRQDADQGSAFEGNTWDNSRVACNRGRGTAVKRGNYPWNKFSAAGGRRGGVTAPGGHQNRSTMYGRTENADSYGNSRSYRGNPNSSSYRSSADSSNNQKQAGMDELSFRTAAHKLALDQQKKYGQCGSINADSYGSSRKTLGIRRSVNNKFVPPVRRSEDEERGSDQGRRGGHTNEENPYAELMLDERLKNIEPKMVELIMNEIMDSGPPVTWDDIAGLELAKTTIQEIIVWPMLRPDIFTGLRGPPKGILLFGPPGTGKTMIGKCIASQSGSTFFSISASSLTSKWIGEGEKMVRAMFAVARCHQPAVIFIDEIDSLLTQRSDSEHESSRRIKTEFLVQLDGATTGSDERLLVVGATNRPQELDEAARRRLVKRLYIPLPEEMARQQIIRNLMENQVHSLTEESIQDVCKHTDGYSGADMANLCREAALGPIRSISFSDIKHISVDQVRPICREDFLSALHTIKASVSDKDLQLYEDWNNKFGISAR